MPDFCQIFDRVVIPEGLGDKQVLRKLLLEAQTHVLRTSAGASLPTSVDQVRLRRFAFALEIADVTEPVGQEHQDHLYVAATINEWLGRLAAGAEESELAVRSK